MQVHEPMLCKIDRFLLLNILGKGWPAWLATQIDCGNVFRRSNTENAVSQQSMVVEVCWRGFWQTTDLVLTREECSRALSLRNPMELMLTFFIFNLFVMGRYTF